MTGARIELDLQVDPSLLGGLDGPRRRPHDRWERPRPPRAAAQPARLGRPLGDPHMAIRSDEITSIIKSAIDQFDAGRRDPQRRDRSSRSATASPRSTACRRPRRRSCSSSRRRDGHRPQPRGGDGRRGHPGRRRAHQGRRHGQDHRPRRRGAGQGQALLGRVVDPLGRPLDDKGPDHDRHRSARSSASPRASSSASRSTRRSRPASRPSTR